MPEMRLHATAFAPGSIGNVGPGLDILGLAIAGAGDEVLVERRDDRAIIIADPGHKELTSDPARHAAAIAAVAVLRRASVECGITLWIRKGLPLSGGQGGSAASAVAGAVATNHLIAADLDVTALLECALEAESTVSGRHADNLAPSLLGGLVLVRSLAPMDVIRLPVPASLRVVLVHPDQQLRTRDAREVLPPTVSRELALTQAANIAAMVAGACLGNLALLGRGLDDQIAEPARRHLLPGFLEAQAAAHAAGALGCSISGAGPTVFALVDHEELGGLVAERMLAAYATAGVKAVARVATVDLEGATLR